MSPWSVPSNTCIGELLGERIDVEAQVALVEAPLRAAMSAQLEPRRHSDTTDQQSLGWRVRRGEAGQIVWHGGVTGGYRCFLMFERARQVGVTVLTNTALTRNGDIGCHLIGGSALSTAPPRREAIHVPGAAMERYVGRYRLSASRNIFLSREEDRLFAQLTGQRRFEVFPQSPTEFFWRVAEATATFEIGPDGCVMGLILHQNGRDFPARRIDPE